MKRSRVPTEPELQAKAGPSENFANERGKAVADDLMYPPAWVGDFLKNCHNCKRALKRSQNIYMYKDFCAYCSEECREIQMEIDNQLEEAEAKKKKEKNGKRAG